MADPDWTDPCAVLTWLRPQYYKVAAGVSEVTLKHGDDSATFNQSSLSGLAAVMRQLESECAAKQGVRAGRRRAFTAG